MARGSAQELYGALPDLTTMGKIVGGGLPLAAFGGRSDIMDHLAPKGPVYQAGTLSGNPLAVAAALAILEQLTPEVYTRWEEIGRAVEEEFLIPATKQGLSFHRVGSMWTLFFREEAPNDFAGCTAVRYGAIRSVFSSGAKTWDLFARESIRSHFLKCLDEQGRYWTISFRLTEIARVMIPDLQMRRSACCLAPFGMLLSRPSRLWGVLK